MSAWGLDVVLDLQTLLLVAAAVTARRVPELRPARTAAGRRAGWWGAPAAAAAALPPARAGGRPRPRQPRHARRFAVIRWRAAGVSPAMVSVLWSESVAAEVLVFFVLGPALVTGLTPAGALVVAALAGMPRWAVMAQSAEVLALALGSRCRPPTLRCSISPACGCSSGSCHWAWKGRRRRSMAQSASGLPVLD